MDKKPQTVEEFTKKRNQRSAIIAIIVISLIIFVYAVTLIRGPSLLADRPSYGVGGPTLEKDAPKASDANIGAQDG